MPVNDTAKNVLGTIGSLGCRSVSHPPIFDLGRTVHRDHLLGGADYSSGVQVMARKVDGGSIALAHVSLLLSFDRPGYELIGRGKVHLERLGCISGRVCDRTGHFHSCKSASFGPFRSLTDHYYLGQIIVQPQLFSTLAAISWVQCLYYEGKRCATVCASVLLVYLALFAGWEVGMTYAIRVRLTHSHSLSLRHLPVHVHAHRRAARRNRRNRGKQPHHWAELAARVAAWRQLFTTRHYSDVSLVPRLLTYLTLTGNDRSRK
jgi:hypothetical protein